MLYMEGMIFMSEPVKRAALYIRVSSDEQAKHGFSLPEQEHDLTTYAHNHGFYIVGMYADEGTTARKALSRRHELMRLLDDVRAGRIDIIIIKCLDRWIRNVADYYKVQDVLDEYNVQWECTQEEYNTTTTNGRLMLNLKLSIAQNESDQTSDRIKYVFEGKKARHEVLTGNLPFGYKVGPDKHYTIDPPAADKVRAMFEFYAIHQNMQETLDYCRETLGLTHRRVSLRRILANKAYIGIRYNIEGYCPAIVGRDLFDRVQATIKKRRGRHSRADRVFIFAGLIRCPICQNAMASSRGHITLKDGSPCQAYRCSYHYIEHHCTYTRTISENSLERYLIGDLSNLLQGYLADIELKARKNRRSNPTAKINAIKQKLDRLKDLYISGCIDRNEYMKDFKRYNGDLSAAIKESAILPESQYTTRLRDLLGQDIAALYARLTRENKKLFWRSIIDYILPISSRNRQPFTSADFRVEFLA